MGTKRFAVKNVNETKETRQSRQLIIAERGVSAKGTSPASSSKAKQLDFPTVFVFFLNRH